jgi:hypothetical protein
MAVLGAHADFSAAFNLLLDVTRASYVIPDLHHNKLWVELGDPRL